MGEGRTGADGRADERLTLREAAARLGVSESAIRKRVERGTLRSDKGPDGKRYVYLRFTVADTLTDTGADTSATHERDALMSAKDETITLLRQQLEAERQSSAELRRIVAALTSRIPELPAASPESHEVGSGALAGQPQGPPAEPEVAEERLPSDAYPEDLGGRPSPPEDLSRAQWVLVGAVMLLPPLTVYTLSYTLPPLSPSLALVLTLVLTVLADWVPPGGLGYWVGQRLTKLRFWRHIAPIGGILIAVQLTSYLYFVFPWPWGGLIAPPGAFFFTLAPAALYSFAALLGNARRRRRREQLLGEEPSTASESDAPAETWSPRAQAMVALVGTVISALISLIGTILTVLMDQGAN